MDEMDHLRRRDFAEQGRESKVCLLAACANVVSAGAVRSHVLFILDGSALAKAFFAGLAAPPTTFDC